MYKISVEWSDICHEGNVEVKRGTLNSLSISKGNGSVAGSSFNFSGTGSARLEMEVTSSGIPEMEGRTIIIVHDKANAFSFLAGDVNKDCPILVPEYKLAVLCADDKRSYSQVYEDIKAKGAMSLLDRIGAEPEESYVKAQAVSRNIPCETWLGIGRDIRIFGTGFFLEENKNEYFDWILPRYHFEKQKAGADKKIQVTYRFLFGRGIGMSNDMTRWIEDGALPILHACRKDGGMEYNVTAFATLEKSRLIKENVRGTHFLVADGYGAGCMFTEEQKKQREALLDGELHWEEETVVYYRVDAVNKTKAPRYAWFKAVEPNAFPSPSNFVYDLKFGLDGDKGFGLYEDKSVYCVSRLNGKPLPRPENAVLVMPGETARYEFFLPHSPVSQERAEKLALSDFDARLDECRKYWTGELGTAARINVPETPIDEKIRAGLLHLDMLAYGREPDGTLAPMIGEYCPIGTESAPIIQFMDSMGWHDTARRAVSYFLDKQHDDGFIQNFGGYMLETGAALWCIGEHYRYTADDGWVESIKEKLLKSCRFIIDWSGRNKRDDLKGGGYGMMDGKVADPEDNDSRHFMLNGYAYMGLARVSEMLRNVDPEQSAYIGGKAEELKGYIRQAFFDSLGKGVLVPAADGTWCPTAAPWVGYHGPLCIYADGGSAFTHYSFPARDSLVGPLYLFFQEVVGTDEQAASFVLKYHSEILYENNAAFSQPYYSMHPWMHLKRGEVKPFLKSYYACVNTMADRETHTFKEHPIYFCSPFKTHEEAWFLMQTRWMLYMEEGRSLKLLGGVPREWLKSGSRIKVDNAASYFGKLSFDVVSSAGKGIIKADIECSSGRKPDSVSMRVPHPDGRKAVKVSGGIYDAGSETVTVGNFGGNASLVVEF